MSLRVRLTLLLTLFVGGALFVAWVVTGSRVIAPFTRQVERLHVEQIINVAEQVEEGDDPDELSYQMGLDLRVLDHPPPFVKKNRTHRRRGCRRLERRGHDVVVCRGPHAPVAVSLFDGGWVIVRRELDADAPGRDIARWLLIIAVSVILFSAWAATRVTRPLRRAGRAMDRIAGGDLAHRIPERGSGEVKEVANAFNRMADRVDSILRAERELMAGISHELRTPLARLRLETEMLRDVESVPAKRLDAMEADLVEMDQLIGELLTVSKLSIGEQKLTKEKTDLKKVAEEAIERTPLPNHEVVLRGTATNIEADHARLVRVVSNLLQNAGKYSDSGTSITIDVDGTSLTVEDQGPGVQMEDMSRLFEPFYRGARGRKSATGGLGLGLMIARQVIELHGGTIEAENREQGLAIRFEL